MTNTRRVTSEIYDEAIKQLIYDTSSPSSLSWINGTNAGCQDNNGYWLIRVGSRPGKLLRAHRIIWYMFNKTLPNILDHVDGNPGNNLLSNLRKATESQNRHNSKKHSDNTSGYKGVYWDSRSMKWMAKVSFNYKSYWGGRFVNKDDAILKVEEMRNQLHKEFAKHD